MASKQLKEFTVEEVAKVRLLNRAELHSETLTTVPVPSIARRETWYAIELLI